MSELRHQQREEEDVLILGDYEVAELLSVDASVRSLEEMYRELGAGTGVNRVRTRTSLSAPGFDAQPEEEFRYTVNSMEGGGSSCGYYAMRLNSVMWQWLDTPSGQRRRVLPQQVGTEYKFDGMMCLFDVRSCFLVSIMPNFSISRRRVAGSSGVAAMYMARPDSSTLGIVGAGSHAVGHALTYAQLFDLEQIKVWSPTPSHVQAFCDHVGRAVAADVAPAVDARDAVDADLVVTATNSMRPVYDAAWINTGSHVTSINPPEATAEMDARADITVVKGKSKTLFFSSPEAGPEPEAEPTGSEAPTWDTCPDLGEVVVGIGPNRKRNGDVTFFRNNAGLGAEFAALGAEAYRLASDKGAGHRLPLSWFCTPLVSRHFGEAWQQNQ